MYGERKHLQLQLRPDIDTVASSRLQQDRWGTAIHWVIES